MSKVDISYKRIGRVTAPVVVTQVSYTAMGLIDTMMVGRLGVLELGAVGLGTLLTWWFLSFFYGLQTGVNTFVAQAYGADEPRQVGVAFWQGFYVALVSGAVIAGIWTIMPWVFSLTRAEPELQALAADYSQIRLLGGIGVTVLLVADNFYRGLGRTDVPMFCAVGQMVLNCAFNYVLIFGHFGMPAMGVRGAALGTVIAQGIIALVLFWSIVGRRSLRRDWHLGETYRLEPRFMLRLLAVSSPVAVQFFMEMGGVSIFAAVVARIGTVEMAATNAVIQAWSATFMIAAALAVGATTLVGQCVGAGEFGLARVATGRVMKLGYLLSAVAVVLYSTVPEWLMSMFVRDAELAPLLPYARPLFLIVAVCLVFDVRFMLLSGALRGAGDTTYSMLVNIGSSWLLFVPATIVAASRFGLIGAWWCMVAHYLLMSVLLDLRYRGSAWLHQVLEEAQETGESDGTAAEPVTAPSGGS